MTKYTGLSLQHNTYVVRVAVPADVRKIIGKRELIQSLQTGDFSEATKKWGPVYKAFKAQIEQARANGAIAALNLQPARLALANWATAEGQKPVVDGDDTDTPWLIQKRIADYEAAWTDPSGWEAIPDFDDKAIEMLTAGGLPIRLGDPILAPLRQEGCGCPASLWRHARQGERPCPRRDGEGSLRPTAPERTFPRSFGVVSGRYRR